MLLYLLYHLSIPLPIHPLIQLIFQWKTFQSKLQIISIPPPKYFNMCIINFNICSQRFSLLMKIHIQHNVQIEYIFWLLWAELCPPPQFLC